MRVLIVEDNAVKARNLARCVRECDSAAEIIHTSNAQDGYTAVLGPKIDLCLLDVLLPLKVGEDPSEEGSLWFVREVHRKAPYKQLPIIVGTTQYLDSISKVEQTFRDFLWSIVFVTDSDDRWRRQIGHAVRFAGSGANRTKLNSAGACVDVAVVTALRIPEFEELIDALGGGDAFQIEETSENWIRRGLEFGGGKHLEIVAACADEMGMCAMAGLVTRVCISCRPKKLILTGIMGGNASRVAMSDLVLVEDTWDCRAGKITETGFEPDMKVQGCDYKLANAAKGIVNEDLLLGIWKAWKGEKPREVPRLVMGAVACSPAVIANDTVFKELEEQKRKVLGVEMEAYGCYHAVHHLGDLAPRAMCLKSVCDLGDKTKADKYQRYCAHLSARVIVEIIKSERFAES